MDNEIHISKLSRLRIEYRLLRREYNKHRKLDSRLKVALDNIRSATLNYLEKNNLHHHLTNRGNTQQHLLFYNISDFDELIDNVIIKLRTLQ